MIQNHKVDVIIGGSTTGATLAVIPMVEKAGVPFISLADSVSIIDPVRKWVFKTSPTDAIACARIFLDMKKRGIKRVALISGDGGFGKSMRSHCLRLAKPFGLSIVADEVYKSDTRRFSAQLKRLRGNAKIQAVLNLGFASAPAHITQSYRKMKFKPPLYQSHGVATADYLEIAGKSADGVRMPVPPMIVADHLAADDPAKKVIATYRRYYEKRWESPASVYGSHAYDAMQIYVNAVRKIGSLDKIKVRQRIENTRGLVGASGIFRMSAANHLGLDISSFRMAEIKAGEWVLAD